MKLRKGDVCLINLSSGFGHEQSGNRPAVILAVTRTNIVVVIPITGNTEALRFSHTLPLKPTTKNGLEFDSVALLFHIRAIDGRRVEQALGRLETTTQSEIDRALRSFLSL